jgi:hypothetical protein
LQELSTAGFADLRGLRSKCREIAFPIHDAIANKADGLNPSAFFRVYKIGPEARGNILWKNLHSKK